MGLDFFDGWTPPGPRLAAGGVTVASVLAVSVTFVAGCKKYGGNPSFNPPPTSRGDPPSLPPDGNPPFLPPDTDRPRPEAGDPKSPQPGAGGDG